MISLFYLIVIITFLNANLSKIIPAIAKRFRLGSSKEDILRKEKVRAMIAELSEINMTDEWAKYAKLQRKINIEKDKLVKSSNEESDKLDGLISTTSWILSLTLGLTITLIVLFNRSFVVAELPEGLLWPFQSLICWSKEIPGGVTVPCWVIISSSVARSLSRFI